MYNLNVGKYMPDVHACHLCKTESMKETDFHRIVNIAEIKPGGMQSSCRPLQIEAAC